MSAPKTHKCLDCINLTIGKCKRCLDCKYKRAKLYSNKYKTDYTDCEICNCTFKQRNLRAHEQTLRHRYALADITPLPKIHEIESSNNTFNVMSDLKEEFRKHFMIKEGLTEEQEKDILYNPDNQFC